MSEMPKSIINLRAWPPDIAANQNIGPAHPNSPYHLVYFGYGEGGSLVPFQGYELERNIAAAKRQFPGFPRLPLHSVEFNGAEPETDGEEVA